MAIPKPGKPGAKGKASNGKAAPTTSVRAPKKFSVAGWGEGANTGDHILFYGQSGIGKTTIAAQVDPVFIGIDAGGRKQTNPMTGAQLRHIPNIEDFQDVRDVLRSYDLFKDEKFVCIDNLTFLEGWAQNHVMSNTPLKSGAAADKFRDYGWDGPCHVMELMVQVLADIDELRRRGVNIISLAQSATRNLKQADNDYLYEAPDLIQQTHAPIRDRYCQEADQVFRIGYESIFVKDRKATGSTSRAVYVMPEVYFFAKQKGFDEIGEMVSYETPKDNSIWQFLYPDLFGGDDG